MDEAAKRRQKREEELIRLEMIRVRKQMEAEKERASRERWELIASPFLHDPFGSDELAYNREEMTKKVKLLQSMTYGLNTFLTGSLTSEFFARSTFPVTVTKDGFMWNYEKPITNGGFSKNIHARVST